MNRVHSISFPESQEQKKSGCFLTEVQENALNFSTRDAYSIGLLLYYYYTLF